MNAKNMFKGLLLAASLFLASPAFAGEKASVRLYEDVKLNGKTLAPGKYEVEWDGSSPQVQLSFRQGKETVATVPARLTPIKGEQPFTGYSTKTEQDGSKALTSVVFAGKKYKLDLGQEEAYAPGKSAETAGNR